MMRTHRTTFFVAVAAVAACLSLTTPVSTVLADGLTARASGVLPIHKRPGDEYKVVDKLANGERVIVTKCTRKANWCRITQLDGGPAGWADGGDLVGSAAKNAVTPF